MADARTTAFYVLYAIETEGAYSNIALNRALKENSLSGIDAAFASSLIYGVIERRITLDYIIRQYTERTPLRKIETKTLIILRMGVLQLIFMDKIPESAAVNESVKLAKKFRLQRSAGFINAVMRSMVRSGCSYRLPQEGSDEYLSVLYSCPQRLIKLWNEDYGAENTLIILEALNGRPPINIRVNTLKTNSDQLIKKLAEEKVEAKKSNFIPDALELSSTGSIEKLPAFKDGDFHVQDLSSQLCVYLLDPKPNQVLLDVCAAPGGKAMTAAQYMNGSGVIYACDIYPHKLRLIESSARRLGITTVKTVLRDALSAQAPIQGADCVLCDVPCSGLGILRRKPEIRYKTDFGIDKLCKLQYDIMCNSADFVKPGGILLYSTCTLNRRENNGNAEKFLQDNRDFRPYPIELPSGVCRRICEKENQLTLFPQTDGTDGFFISVFQRRK